LLMSKHQVLEINCIRHILVRCSSLPTPLPLNSFPEQEGQHVQKCTHKIITHKSSSFMYSENLLQHYTIGYKPILDVVNKVFKFTLVDPNIYNINGCNIIGVGGASKVTIHSSKIRIKDVIANYQIPSKEFCNSRRRYNAQCTKDSTFLESQVPIAGPCLRGIVCPLNAFNLKMTSTLMKMK